MTYKRMLTQKKGDTDSVRARSLNEFLQEREDLSETRKNNLNKTIPMIDAEILLWQKKIEFGSKRLLQLAVEKQKMIEGNTLEYS